MSPELSDLLKRALALPNDERAALANTLLYSLEISNKCVEEAWDEEVARRMDDLKAGRGRHRSLGATSPRASSHVE